MALDYESLFQDLGAFIRAVDELKNTGTYWLGFPDHSQDPLTTPQAYEDPTPNLKDLLTNINQTLNDNNTDHILDGVNNLFSSIADAMSGYAAQVSDKCDERLTDRTSVLNELLSTNSSSTAEVNQELIRQMGAIPQNVAASVVTLMNEFQTTWDNDGTGNPLNPGAAPYDVQPSKSGLETGLAMRGTGELHLTDLLDGFSPPATGFAPHLNYVGKLTELVVPDDKVALTCIADVDSNATPEGQEIFQVEGQLPLEGNFDWKTEGSGEVVEVSTDNAAEIMANRDWEAWNADATASSWTATTGIPGVDFAPDYDLNNVFRGNASLKILGAGPTVVLEQTAFLNLLNPVRAYRLSFAYKATGAHQAVIKLELYSPSNPNLFTGDITHPDGNIPQRLIVDLAVPPTAEVENWPNGDQTGTPYYPIPTTMLYTPSNMPDDLVFRLSVTNIAGGDEIWIDSMTFAPVNYVGGVGYNILAGATSYTLSDRYKVRNTSIEGLYQRFFRRKYNVQLESTTGTPTISESWISPNL